MTRIVWSPTSLSNLELIRAYIAQDPPQPADVMLGRIFAAAEWLKRFPEAGAVVPELKQLAIRELIVRPYRIVYRLRNDLVEIVAVSRSWALVVPKPSPAPKRA